MPDCVEKADMLVSEDRLGRLWVWDVDGRVDGADGIAGAGVGGSLGC